MGLARPVGRGEPALHDGVADRLQPVPLDRRDAGVPALGVADPGGGVAEHEGGEPPGVPHGEALRDHPADREADEAEALDAEMVDEGEEVVDVPVDGDGAGAEVGEAVAALVVEQQAIVLGELGRHSVPDAEVGAERVREAEDGLLLGIADQLGVDDGVAALDEDHGRRFLPVRMSDGVAPRPHRRGDEGRGAAVVSRLTRGGCVGPPPGRGCPAAGCGGGAGAGRGRRPAWRSPARRGSCRGRRPR